MDTGILLRLLASLQILPHLASPAAPLPAPTVIAYPQHPVYFPGESLTLQCLAPPGKAVSSYQFYNQRRERVFTVSSEPAHWPWLVMTTEMGKAGAYSCAYWAERYGQLMSSARSQPVLVSVMEHPEVPSLSLYPARTVYLPGETVTLTCSVPPGAHTATGFQFSRDDSCWRVSSGSNNTHALIVTGLGDSGSYTCSYWIRPSRWGVQSQESQPVSISITDRPSQPVLSMAPPSGVVSEGFPLLITCTSSGDDAERTFHFYRDGTEIVPGDAGSEISTTEPGTGSRNISVLSIPRATPNSSGEFTCVYEENVCGRWIPSPSSQALNLTMYVIDRVSNRIHVIQLLGIGGVLLLAGALTSVICYCRRKKRGEKLQESTKGFEGRECNRDLDPGHDNNGPKVMGAGVEQREQGSEVTYALIAFSALEARTTQSKRKAQPAEDEHVLYSEVVTKHTQKTDK